MNYIFSLILIYFFPFLWFFVFVKKILFWTWLWQLKEYHIGRFLDHFRTKKGKRLFCNWFSLLKISLIFSTSIIVIKIGDLILWLVSNNHETMLQALFLYLTYFPYLLLALYFLESIKALVDTLKKRLKRPILTAKTISLILANLTFVIAFSAYNFSISSPLTSVFAFPQISLLFDCCFWALALDILAPLIISLIVLLFQPLTVFLRNQLIIKKAKNKRESFKDLLVIGITGSYGKTSTKEFLATILSEKFNVLKTKENQNSEVGISQCIINDLKPEHEIFICEMGAYNQGGIKFLCDIAQPKIGILTGINEQHMATFGSQENIIATKFELIESLLEDGMAILNWDNEHIKLKIESLSQIKPKGQKSKLEMKAQKFCSTKEKKDIWAEDIKVEKETISFSVFSKQGDSGSLKLNLLGAHNTSNVLMAICAAKELGMSFEQILKACEKIKPYEKTMEIKSDVCGAMIIDDSYSANPKGVIAALDYLKVWPDKKVVIMPCLIELGKASKSVHQKIGEKIGKVCDLAIITTKDRFEQIKKGAVSSGMKQENILFLENPEKIFLKIEPYLKAENVVLLESRMPQKLLNWLIRK